MGGRRGSGDPSHGRLMPIETDWTAAEQDAMRQLRRRVRPGPRKCYAICQRMILVADEWGWTAPGARIRVEYAEGIATSVAQLHHAWLLLNFKVWDPAWERALGGPGVAYFGRTVPVARVRAVICSLRMFGPTWSISPERRRRWLLPLCGSRLLSPERSRR